MDTYASTMIGTLVAELAVAALLLRGRRPKDLLPILIAANLVTHPIATLLVQGPGPLIGFWPAEILVITAEFLIYRSVAGLKPRDAIQLSLAANGLTIALSFVIL